MPHPASHFSEVKAHKDFALIVLKRFFPFYLGFLPKRLCKSQLRGTKERKCGTLSCHKRNTKGELKDNSSVKAADKVRDFTGNGDVDRKEGHQMTSVANLKEDDKSFEAIKFIEKLKALLKLDDQDYLGTQDGTTNGTGKHSLQVSEVTSSNINYFSDVTVGTESGTPSNECEEVVGNVDKFENGQTNKLYSVPKETCTHKNIDSPLKGTGKGNEVQMDSAAAGPGSIGHCVEQDGQEKLVGSGQFLLEHQDLACQIQVGSASSMLATRLYPCSICKAKFVSYSRLKRHKRVVHKLYCKNTESTRTKVQTYKCSLCLQQVESLKKLKLHMRNFHKITRKIPTSLMQASSVHDFDAINFLDHDAADFTLNCLGSCFFLQGSSSGLLECSLCGASFLTFDGQKGHLKSKHNIWLSQKNDKSAYTKRKKRNKEFVSTSKNPQNGAGEKSGFSTNFKDGYDSDTDTKCKKCESVFNSVRERREHSLETHGLHVSFEGEEFLFMEIDLTSREERQGKKKPPTSNKSKESVIDMGEKFFCIKTLSCKLCPAKYEIYKSLQKHMLRKHNVRAYKSRHIVQKTHVPPGSSTFKVSASNVSRNSAKKDKESPTSPSYLFDNKQFPQIKNPLQDSPNSPEARNFKKTMPVPISNGSAGKMLPNKTVESSHKLFLYKLGDQGETAKKPSSGNKDSPGNVKFLLYTKKRSDGKLQMSGNAKTLSNCIKGTKENVKVSPNNAEVTLYEAPNSCARKSFPKKVKQPLEGGVLGLTDLASPDNGSVPARKEMASSEGQLMSPHNREIPSNIEKFCDKVKLQSNQSGTTSKSVVIAKEKGGRENASIEILSSEKPEQPSSEDNQIDGILWETNFARKKFSCLICDAPFSGFHIQRRHMLSYHDIRLDNIGNRVTYMESSIKEKKSNRSSDDVFGKSSNQKHNGNDSDDDLHSSLLYEYEYDAEDSYKTITLDNGEQRFLCSHCPLLFDSLIDRLIHIKDAHKDTSEQLSGETRTSQISTAPVMSSNMPGPEAVPSLEPVTPTQSNEDVMVQEVPEGGACKRKLAVIESRPPRKKRRTEMPGVFPCYLCENVYRYYKSLHRHVRGVHNAVPLKRAAFETREDNSLAKNPQCSVCERTFRCVNFLFAHMKSAHNIDAKSKDMLESPAKNGVILHESKQSLEESLPPTAKDDCDSKRDRQVETVRSNLLAISIKDGAMSDADHFKDNNETMSIAPQVNRDGSFSPVPPCDESEFSADNLEVVEDNVFSRLQARVFFGPYESVPLVMGGNFDSSQYSSIHKNTDGEIPRENIENGPKGKSLDTNVIVVDSSDDEEEVNIIGKI